ncbi:MAG: GNAT family N-acetyltransferase [Clostridia bacterium]|nr:GNAT family N-acetyltransferase [Clostridia bacterium]
MLKLVKLEEKYKKQLFEMMDEWDSSGEKIIPYAIRKADYHNFDIYKESIEVREETKNSVPDSTYFALDIERDIFVGAVNIRHYLNDQLLLNGGHIGDGVRPSERRKGYATEMIRLALEECRKLGIDRVLMVCYKDNIGSAKSIINNGGVLENEIPAENGKIDQRYWISLKKRYVDRYMNKRVKKVKQKIVPIKEEHFIGDIYFYDFIEVEDKLVISNGKCIMDNNYKWLEFYDYNSKVKLTAIYDENNEIIEWYFDIARKIGKENSVPFEDDLYLDVVVTSNGDISLLDEDELKEAFDRFEVNKEDYDMAYNEAEQLMNILKDNKEKLKNFTEKYLKEMLKE